MKTVAVKSSRGAYQILIGQNLLSKTGRFLSRLGLKGKIMVVTQDEIARLYFKKLEASLKASGFQVFSHLLENGETAKSEAELFRLYHALSDKDFERQDVLLALGGGVVGDLTGFAAATYLRGISFVNLPTTLLAQVDSSIGGKTGINLRQGKNLVGAFYPPKLVISDIATLKTLPPRELYASLAEVVKYGVIRDPKLFRFLEVKSSEILSKQPAALEKIVLASASIKAGVVTRDEHETKGERMILNFGHTYGHGLEQALDYRKLLHGEAVAIGMVCAAETAVKMKFFSQKDFQRLTGTLKKLKLPVSASGLNADLDKTVRAMSRDKKKKAGSLRFVLPVRIGKVVIRQDVSSSLVEEILMKQGVIQ